jgi:hypothetical protein
MEEIETGKREKQRKQQSRGKGCKGICDSIRGSALFIGGVVGAQKIKAGKGLNVRRGGVKGKMNKGCIVF